MHSPSRVMIAIGANAAQSFTQGFDRTYTSPHLGLAIDRPSVSVPRRGTTVAQGGNPITIHVTVQGNVTAEDDLKLAIVRAVNTGIVEGTRQRNRAMGMV